MVEEATAAQLRDEGIAKVLENETEDWKAKARASADQFIASLDSGAKFTGEDVRLHVEAEVGPYHHPNAWGGIVGASLRGAMGIGEIKAVGVAHARRKTSHKRLYPQYRVYR